MKLELSLDIKKVHRCRIILLPHIIKETSMNTITISRKQKHKHLSFQHYEFIINSIIKFNAEHSASKRNIGKTDFINTLAASVGTSTSNSIPSSSLCLQFGFFISTLYTKTYNFSKRGAGAPHNGQM